MIGLLDIKQCQVSDRRYLISARRYENVPEKELTNNSIILYARDIET